MNLVGVGLRRKTARAGVTEGGEARSSRNRLADRKAATSACQSLRECGDEWPVSGPVQDEIEAAEASIDKYLFRRASLFRSTSSSAPATSTTARIRRYTSMACWLMKAEPDSRIVKNTNVKVGSGQT